MNRILHDIHRRYVFLNAAYTLRPFSTTAYKKAFNPFHNEFLLKGSHERTPTWKLSSCFTKNRSIYGLISKTYLNHTVPLVYEYEQWALTEWQNDWRKQKCLKKNLSKHQSIHQKSHKNFPQTELTLLQTEASDSKPETQMTYLRRISTTAWGNNHCLQCKLCKTHKRTLRVKCRAFCVKSGGTYRNTQAIATVHWMTTQDE
jgi:hypothetical protein